MTEPRNALVKQYKRLFELEDTKLTFTDDALTAIAEKAIERKTGARGLRSIIENMLLDTMYDLPDLDDVEEIIVNKDTVKNESQPVFVHSKDAKKKSSKKKKDDGKSDEKAEASK